MPLKHVKERLLQALRFGPHVSGAALFMANNVERGIVQWDASPPVGVSYVVHKEGILDAIEMASKFLETDYTQEREWLMIGDGGRCILLTLTAFAPYFEDGLYKWDDEHQGVHLGYLFHRSVFYSRRMPKTHMLLFNTNRRTCHIEIANAWF